MAPCAGGHTFSRQRRRILHRRSPARVVQIRPCHVCLMVRAGHTLPMRSPRDERSFAHVCDLCLDYLIAGMAQRQPESARCVSDTWSATWGSTVLAQDEIRAYIKIGVRRVLDRDLPAEAPQMLTLMASGLTTAEVATQLRLNIEDVHHRLAKTIMALSVTSQLAAIVCAARLGLIVVGVSSEQF
jgi:DNA-binding NarL/FixJ family response regulator